MLKESAVSSHCPTLRAVPSHILKDAIMTASLGTRLCAGPDLKRLTAFFIGRIFTTRDPRNKPKSWFVFNKELHKGLVLSYSLVLPQESLPFSIRISALLSQSQPLRTVFFLFLLKTSQFSRPPTCSYTTDPAISLRTSVYFLPSKSVLAV